MTRAAAQGILATTARESLAAAAAATTVAASRSRARFLESGRWPARSNVPSLEGPSRNVSSFARLDASTPT
jgi:hypothetical protein